MAGVRELLAFMWAFPGKQLLFMGCELADEREWSEQRGMDWILRHDPPHLAVSSLVTDLNAAYRANPALWTLDTSPSGFAWIVGDDAANNVFAFARYGDDGSVLVCVCNFSALPQEHYRLGLPVAGTWLELVNTDSQHYEGSGVGNLGEVTTEHVPWHGQAVSVTLRLPPLGALWLVPAPVEPAPPLESTAA
jgi:1,4-alpha-glucan branching enzyme